MIKKEVVIEEFETAGLTETDERLLEKAKNVALTAYAPYSDFKVGAALLMENGEMLAASNQENAAYPSGICAERNVVFFAGANFSTVKPRVLLIIALSRGEMLDEPAAPCGSCLQVLWQYERRHETRLEVVLVGREISWKVRGMDQLLPFAFRSLDGLGK